MGFVCLSCEYLHPGRYTSDRCAITKDFEKCTSCAEKRKLGFKNGQEYGKFMDFMAKIKAQEKAVEETELLKTRNKMEQDLIRRCYNLT